MRRPGIFLLLLLVIVALTSRDRIAAFPVPVVTSSKALASVADATAANDNAWRYAKDAPYHDVLPVAVQNFQATDPELAADTVCDALGGRLGHIESPHAGADALDFLCRFEEPDLTMSVEFGELRRIPVNQ